MYIILKTEVLSLTALQQENVQNTDTSTSSMLDLHCIQVPIGRRIIQVPVGHRIIQVPVGHRIIQVPVGHRNQYTLSDLQISLHKAAKNTFQVKWWRTSQNRAVALSMRVRRGRTRLPVHLIQNRKGRTVAQVHISIHIEQRRS